MDVDELVSWARREAKLLRVRAQGDGPLRRSPTAAVDFLRRYASGSAFYEQAKACASAEATASSTRAGVACRRIAHILDSWADFTEAGLAHDLPLDARIRVEAATDLMEQVQRLLEDNNVHPAAPVVLLGAALEEYLRSMYVGCTEPLLGRPSLATYATALRKADSLSALDVKDITAWAGLRNEAAHGHFDDLNRERAKIMFEGINLFMRQHAAVSTPR